HCECGNQRSTQPGRHARRTGDQHAEHGDRCRDADFNPGQVDTHHARHSAHDHHQREGQRQHPFGIALHLCGPDTDRNHRQQMIEAGKRMRESGAQIHCVMRTDVGESRAGGKTQQAKRCNMDANSDANFGNLILWMMRHIVLLYWSIEDDFLLTVQLTASTDVSDPNKPFVLSSPSGVSKAAQPSIRSLRYALFDTLRYSGRTDLLRANGPTQRERTYSGRTDLLRANRPTQGQQTYPGPTDLPRANKPTQGERTCVRHEFTPSLRPVQLRKPG